MSTHPRQLLALLAGTGTVASIAAVATFAVTAVGFPTLETGEGEALVGKQEVSTTATAWSPTPASTVLTSVLSEPPHGWKKKGRLQRGVTAPLPYSCPLPGISASTALAQSYTADGHSFQVITLAYTAGLGAEAMHQMEANAHLCAPEDHVYLGSLSGPGVEATYASTSKGGTTNIVLSSRRGDVITYVTGRSGVALGNLADTFDDKLAPELAPVCVDEHSTTIDASRSPFSHTGYEPHTRTATVEIRDVELPDIPDKRRGLKRADIPAKNLVEGQAWPMAQPEFPVWPPMPEPVAYPQLPESPAATADTEATLQVPAEDAKGPGCGWAFTGMKPLRFDEQAAGEKTERLTSTARKNLKREAEQWQDDVLAFWISYADYRKDAARYDEYRERVEEVNTAWANISEDWDSYYAELAAYEARVAERDAFLAEQEEAAETYEHQQELCSRPPEPQPEETPEPSPEPSREKPGISPTAPADPEVQPEPTMTPIPEAREGCPAEKPAILDQDAPDPGPEPQRPEDPAP